MRLLQRFSVAAAIITMLIPAATSAHFGSEVDEHANANANISVNAQLRAEDNRQDGDHDDMGLHLGQFMTMFTKGTVSSESTSSFVIKTKDDTSVTVNTSGASLIRLPRTAIALSDIKVGDRVWVQGTRSGDTITATKVYDLSADVKPAMRSGTITSINSNTVTLQTKNNSNVSVTTDSNTQVKKDGVAGTLSDIQVGAKVKIFGIWDKITNLFTAVLIKLK